MLYYASRTLAANSVPEVRGAQTDHRWLIGLQKYALIQEAIRNLQKPSAK